ncbi:Hypothetical predicted protein [Olea europaea subsp. europaea]|uniref:Uncharacterized protein n=1 Tax=Olea europaea subsp. europaea TaxID=158383 RepID=A0A8S0QHI8_OLEEU|nr:Hypothetical predicted protein [Olea europaea subsp. europaea]
MAISTCGDLSGGCYGVGVVVMVMVTNGGGVVGDNSGEVAKCSVGVGCVEKFDTNYCVRCVEEFVNYLVDL